MELGTLSHLPSWLPVLRRGRRPDSPPTWGTAQAEEDRWKGSTWAAGSLGLQDPRVPPPKGSLGGARPGTGKVGSDQSLLPRRPLCSPLL